MTLTAVEIAYMRAVQTAALPDTCIIYRPAFTATDAGGERATTPTTVGTEACAVDVLSRESERILSGRYASLPQYLVVLAYDTDALVGDYIVYSSERYELVGKLEDGAWKTAARFAAVRHPA
jgi:hypothetical protein